MRSKNLWAAAGLLLVGGLIYILFRSHTLLYHLVGDVWPWIEGVRHAVPVPPEFVVYSLPDALWAAAYIALVDGALHTDSPSERIFWAALIPAVGILLELAQWILPNETTIMGVSIGTFDPLDLLCYALPYIFYISFLGLKVLRS